MRWIAGAMSGLTATLSTIWLFEQETWATSWAAPRPTRARKLAATASRTRDRVLIRRLRRLLGLVRGELGTVTVSSIGGQRTSSLRREIVPSCGTSDWRDRESGVRGWPGGKGLAQAALRRGRPFGEVEPHQRCTRHRHLPEHAHVGARE